MYRELNRDSHAGGTLAVDESRTLDLRSILKESIDLPADVLSADFSHIQDRILDQQTISDLVKPCTPETETGDSSQRRQRRKKALMPYLDQRLVCVCIRLPGVIYTIEIGPETEKVVHWEWQPA